MVIDEDLRGEWNGFLVYPGNLRVSSSFDRSLSAYADSLPVRLWKWIGVAPGVWLRGTLGVLSAPRPPSRKLSSYRLETGVKVAGAVILFSFPPLNNLASRPSYFLIFGS